MSSSNANSCVCLLTNFPSFSSFFFFFFFYFVPISQCQCHCVQLVIRYLNSKLVQAATFFVLAFLLSVLKESMLPLSLATLSLWSASCRLETSVVCRLVKSSFSFLRFSFSFFIRAIFSSSLSLANLPCKPGH